MEGARATLDTAALRQLPCGVWRGSSTEDCASPEGELASRLQPQVLSCPLSSALLGSVPPAPASPCRAGAHFSLPHNGLFSAPFLGVAGADHVRPLPELIPQCAWPPTWHLRAAGWRMTCSALAGTSHLLPS